MIEIKGKYNTAIVYTDSIERSAEGQIKAVCDMEAFKDNRIRIMPDVHAGMGCTIGTTMTITDKIVPGMVGVDIGCGMETVKLSSNELSFDELDRIIRSSIPSGTNIRDEAHPYLKDIDLDELRCRDKVDLKRARLSIGTLGSGNHFIEVDKGEDGSLYLVVHSGSRHLGKQVAEYYQEAGFDRLCGTSRKQIVDMIRAFKEMDRTKDIEKHIKELKKKKAQMTPVAKDLAYVEDDLFDDYIHDMKIVQKFAVFNRKAMVDVILSDLGIEPEEIFTTIHNYIDMDSMILRKGAVSAKKGEKLLIPINMRDGSLICIGKGNEDWNYSAPHGAGRIMSRKAATENLSMEEYREQMKDIYSTSVSKATLDEAPMAYKDMKDIVDNIGPTCDIVENIKPVYNFKAP